MQDENLDFQSAIRKIEERGDFNRFSELRPAFEKRLKELKPGDHTERGICYYYLLVSYLKAHLVHETTESREFYDKMDQAFMKQREVFAQNKKDFSWGEIRDFFRLMERCYSSIELLYIKQNFRERKRQSYIRKMTFRKDAYRFQREMGHWLEYKILDITSNYGTSLLRWAITTLAFIVLMSFVYMGLDIFTEESARIVQSGGHWFDYFYFSMITLSAVGFGDIVPLTFLAKILTVFQAFTGFLMLGIFIGLVHKRL